jgi:hypothetical protein
MPSASARARGALLVFSVSLAVRLVLLLALPPAALIGDEEYYWHDYAEAISRGQHLTFSQQVRPPLWGYVLSLPYRLDADPVSGRAFAAVTGALACQAVYVLACRVYGERVGLAAGMVQALLPEHALFSNYLWSEVWFGLLVVVSCIFLFGSRVPERRRRDELLASAVLGLAFLSKEFGFVPFLALLLSWIQKRRGLGTAVLCALLFLLPAGAYSLASSVKNDRWFFLSRAMVANLGQATQLPFRAEDDVGTQLSRWLGRLTARSPRDLAGNAVEQASKLWGFHSFCVWRLLSDPHKPSQPAAYVGGPYPRVALLVSIAYAAVFILGACGLGGASGDFRWFSIGSLALLTSTAAIALLVSRFRVPFDFILSIHAGLVLAEPGRVFSALKNRMWSRILIAASIALMVYGGVKHYGYWG